MLFIHIQPGTSTASSSKWCTSSIKPHGIRFCEFSIRFSTFLFTTIFKFNLVPQKPFTFLHFFHSRILDWDKNFYIRHFFITLTFRTPLYTGIKIREISYCAKNRDRVLADWTKSPKSCAKFVGTKPVENIMEWHHVTVAEDFLNGASDVWQPCK